MSIARAHGRVALHDGADKRLRPAEDDRVGKQNISEPRATSSSAVSISAFREGGLRGKRDGGAATRAPVLFAI